MKLKVVYRLNAELKKIVSAFEPSVLFAISFLATVAFVFYFPYRPVLSGNQGQYFIRGLSIAGIGQLDNDWRTQLTDGFPAFSYLIATAYQIHGPLIVFLIFFALVYAYIYSLLSISQQIFPPVRSPATLALLAFILVTIHTAYFVSVTRYLIGFELRTALTWGFAGFYMLDGFLEMSTFGILLILAVERQIHGKRYQAAFWSAFCCWFHPVLLVPAALMTVVFAWDNWRRATSDWSFLGPASLTLLLVVPQVAYVLTFFGKTSPEIAAEAADILADRRYPHHVHLERWLFDADWLRRQTLVQILVMATAFIVVPNKLIRVLIVILSLYVTVSIAYYAATGDNRFGISIPWRPTVVLVPLSSALIVAALLSAGMMVRSAARVAAVMLAAVSVPYLVTALRVPGLEVKKSSLVRYVFENVRSTDILLIPPTMEWGQFRAQTGAPLLVDFKNHPLKDVEVIEWYQRILDVRPAYDGERLRSCEVVDGLIQKYGITKVITSEGFVECKNLAFEFDAGQHKVLSVTPAQ